MDKIKIVDFKFQGKEWAHLLDVSSHVFDDLPRVKINQLNTNEKYYLLLHIRQPFDVSDLIKSIPNDLFLLMQQGVVKPVINMMTEQWDLFDTYAWDKNRLGLTPDFGETPYSQFIKNFTQRSVPEENITWIVPNNSHIKQINFLRNKGYKICCKFLVFDYFAYVLRGQALKQQFHPLIKPMKRVPNKSLKKLQQLYPTMKETDLETLDKVITDRELEELLKSHGIESE